MEKEFDILTHEQMNSHVHVNVWMQYLLIDVRRPVEVNVAGDGLSGVLGAVVAQLIVLSQYKEPLPPHLALLDQPACACGGWGGGGSTVRTRVETTVSQNS